jgi:hypothetical protein
MATTTNYGWTTPDNTALVKDGASAIRTLGSSIDTTLKAQIDAQIPDTLLTTTGDVIYASAANTPARLGIGTTGQVLQVSGGLPVWATAPAGGMTLISTTTLSGASITLSSIPADYVDLRLIVRNFLPATDGQSMRMRFNGDSANRYAGTSTINLFDQSISTSYISFSSGQDNASSASTVSATIPDYKNTSTWKSAVMDTFTQNATTPANVNYERIIGIYNQTAAISSITFFLGTGNFSSGTVLLYGVK